MIPKETRTLYTKRIDNKHAMYAEVTTTGGTVELLVNLGLLKANAANSRIPDEEPVILFRGRDHLALPLLAKYREMCVADGCTDYQLASMDDMIRKFSDFAANNPGTMKQPGCTRGL